MIWIDLVTSVVSQLEECPYPPLLPTFDPPRDFRPVKDHVFVSFLVSILVSILMSFLTHFLHHIFNTYYSSILNTQLCYLQFIHHTLTTMITTFSKRATICKQIVNTSILTLFTYNLFTLHKLPHIGVLITLTFTGGLKVLVLFQHMSLVTCQND